MSRREQVTLTNLCMIYDDDGNMLVQDRIDPTWPGVTFPGGHVEPGESFHDAVIREVYEETGLTIQHPRLCGVKEFMQDDNARYLVLFYKTNEFHGQLTSSEEGDVFWIPRDTLSQYTLASDFDVMMKVFEKEEISEFFYERDSDPKEDWKIRLY